MQAVVRTSGLFIRGWLPGGAAIGGFVAAAVPHVPNGGVLRIRCVDAAEIARDRRSHPLPMLASIGRTQERSGNAGYPANFVGGRKTAGKRLRHTSRLRHPGAAAVFGVKDLAALPDAPDLLSAGRGDLNVESG